MRTILIMAILLFSGAGISYAGGSSFQRSCSNINLHLEHSNAWIQADCGDGRGGYNYTQLAIRGVHNINGNLQIDNQYYSSFQRSCRDAYLEWEHSYVILRAICGNGRGMEIQTSIYLNNIHNKNGFLVYGN